jgi:hypothetical protein
METFNLNNMTYRQLLDQWLETGDPKAGELMLEHFHADPNTVTIEPTDPEWAEKLEAYVKTMIVD